MEGRPDAEDGAVTEDDGLEASPSLSHRKRV